MIVNAVFIVGSCGNAECVSAVGLILEVDPIPERHIRLDFIGRASALIFQLFQLCTAFRFRLGGYAFCNRLTFLVVVYNNPAFPPPVFSQAERSIPFFLRLAIFIPSVRHNLIHKAPHDSGSVSLHIGGHMRIGIQRKTGVCMT